MSLLCKLVIRSIENHQNDNGEVEFQRIDAQAVVATCKENAVWSKATPSGALSLCITNPAAFDQFRQGQEILVDISPAALDTPAVQTDGSAPEG